MGNGSAQFDSNWNGPSDSYAPLFNFIMTSVFEIMAYFDKLKLKLSERFMIQAINWVIVFTPVFIFSLSFYFGILLYNMYFHV